MQKSGLKRDAKGTISKKQRSGLVHSRHHSSLIQINEEMLN